MWFNPYNRESREKNAMVMYTNCLDPHPDPDPCLKIWIRIRIRIRIKIRWIHITAKNIYCFTKYAMTIGTDMIQRCFDCAQPDQQELIWETLQ